MSTTSRKDQHIDICLARDVSSGRSSGLAEIQLPYDALPEVDLAEVDLSTELLGKSLSAPILAGALTGGTERGAELNRRIARVAERLGLGMCLGSQRVMLERPETAAGFAVRREAPGLPLLIGNLGAVQLNCGVRPTDVVALVEAVDADAMCFHLNPLQEAAQPEGDTNFRGLVERLRETVAALPVPALAKEVGSGISRRTADKLAAIGFAGVESAGLGGTSWTRAESYRAAPFDPRAEIGRALKDWGLSTADAIQACRAALPDGVVIGSGGVRSGYEAAVALYLGADAVALAAPVLRAAVDGEHALERVLRAFIEELRVVLFGMGRRTPAELHA